MSTDDTPSASRRALLTAAGGAITFPAATTRAGAAAQSHGERRCPEATIGPSMGHCEDATMEGCADDHPATRELRAAVEATLADRYPTIGSLIDDGFLPYFDALDSDEGGWSHWLNPEYIGDDTVLDPNRPGSVLVDNDRWVPIGVMFVATAEGEPVDPPPPVYGADAPNEERCSPWHYHAGLPGRFAWWYYERVYEDAGHRDLRLPCRTPCMMHVWTVEHPEGVYAHGGPPPEYRDGAPAEAAGFDTAARPGEDRLGWDVLPDHVVPERTPDEFRWP